MRYPKRFLTIILPVLLLLPSFGCSSSSNTPTPPPVVVPSNLSYSSASISSTVGQALVAAGPSYLQAGQQTPQISPDDTLIAIPTISGLKLHDKHLQE